MPASPLSPPTTNAQFPLLEVASITFLFSTLHPNLAMRRFSFRKSSIFAPDISLVCPRGAAIFVSI
ncbi:hypothetical protein EJ06DRAFT_228433 [Trichodelitschia bisporula]|uniref:Uncharacterized protein n=1 Tax=Trichodelitschia bisporula TaxID=703511 RepID=A0A6G1HL77_9PEZI|nr:hypothetical protein EJ06DRAFT_228433 [Trichodelitschia bisporula]